MRERFFLECLVRYFLGLKRLLLHLVEDFCETPRIDLVSEGTRHRRFHSPQAGSDDLRFFGLPLPLSIDSGKVDPGDHSVFHLVLHFFERVEVFYALKVLFLIFCLARGRFGLRFIVRAVRRIFP